MVRAAEATVIASLYRLASHEQLSLLSTETVQIQSAEALEGKSRKCRKRSRVTKGSRYGNGERFIKALQMAQAVDRKISLSSLHLQAMGPRGSRAPACRGSVKSGEAGDRGVTWSPVQSTGCMYGLSGSQAACRRAFRRKAVALPFSLALWCLPRRSHHGCSLNAASPAPAPLLSPVSTSSPSNTSSLRSPRSSTDFQYSRRREKARRVLVLVDHGGQARSHSQESVLLKAGADRERAVAPLLQRD